MKERSEGDEKPHLFGKMCGACRDRRANEFWGNSRPLTGTNMPRNKEKYRIRNDE